MTATRDRRTIAAAGAGPVPWNERPVFGRSRGLAWWVAVVLALVLTAVGAAVDQGLHGKPGLAFQVCYVLGCVAAVCWVQRRSLFGPMVQPPLILAVALPGVLLMMSSGGTTASRALAFANPLISNFITMAGTTVATVLIGVFRLFTQRRPRQVRRSTPPRSYPEEVEQDHLEESPDWDYQDEPAGHGHEPPPRGNPARGRSQRPPAGPRGQSRGQSFDDW